MDVLVPSALYLRRFLVLRHDYGQKRGLHMSFADTLLTEDLQPLRQKLLYHSLWTGIEQGTVTREQLRRFALQDWWLVREAYRLDALAIASAADLETQELLIAKLQP